MISVYPLIMFKSCLSYEEKMNECQKICEYAKEDYNFKKIFTEYSETDNLKYGMIMKNTSIYMKEIK